MARTSSLNKYLASTPYAALSMEALESDQMDVLFLSLESEVAKFEALRSMRVTIQNVKGINREMALSLESIDGSILPFKPVGFTSAPSRTGLVLTQESLGRAITEGAKKVWEIVLELIKRLGAVLGLNKAATQAAKRAAKRAKAVKNDEYRNLFSNEAGDAILQYVARAGTVEILKKLSESFKNDLLEQSHEVSKILAAAAAKDGRVDQMVEMANRYDLAYPRVSDRLHAYGVTVDFSSPADELKRNYFVAIEARAERTARNYSLDRITRTLSDFGNQLDATAATNDALSDDLARANENINRMIKQAQASGSEWFGPELVNALSRVYRGQMKIFNLMRDHLTYCTLAIEKVNDRLDDVRKEVA